MTVFRHATSAALAFMLLAIPAHVVLLASDSPSYRMWVYVQMLLLVSAALFLWHARKIRPGAVACFAVVCVPIIYINATVLNYGNGIIVWLLPLGLLAAYLGIAASTIARLRSAAGGA